jgi:hypothetical protein
LVLIEYQEDTNTVSLKGTYQHSDQIFDLETSAHDESLVISSWMTSNCNHGVSLWRLHNHDNNELTVEEVSPSIVNQKEKLDKVAEFNTEANVFSKAKWHHIKDTIVVASSKSISSWSVTDCDVKVSFVHILYFVYTVYILYMCIYVYVCVCVYVYVSV